MKNPQKILVILRKSLYNGSYYNDSMQMRHTRNTIYTQI